MEPLREDTCYTVQLFSGDNGYLALLYDDGDYLPGDYPEDQYTACDPTSICFDGGPAQFIFSAKDIKRLKKELPVINWDKVWIDEFDFDNPLWQLEIEDPNWVENLVWPTSDTYKLTGEITDYDRKLELLHDKIKKIEDERLAKVEAQLKWEEKHKDELSHKDNQMPF